MINNEHHLRRDSGGEKDAQDADMDELTAALENTLDGLNRSIAKMEEIVRTIEAGEPDWEESIKLLSEANELAESSSRKLDQVVQDVVYGESAESDSVSGRDARDGSLPTEKEAE